MKYRVYDGDTIDECTEAICPLDVIIGVLNRLHIPWEPAPLHRFTVVEAIV